MNAFVCATPVQILRAIHMHSMIPEYMGESDIYIGDFFIGAKGIAKNLEKTNFFREVHYVKYPRIRKLVPVQLMFRLQDGFIWTLKMHRYKRLIGFNIDSVAVDALYRLSKNNPGFQYDCVEDAPGVYTLYVPEKYKWYKGGAIFGLEKAYFHMRKWWFSQPRVMHTEERVSDRMVQLPPMDPSDKRFINVVNTTFEYVPDEDLYSADILIMEESLFTDGKMVDNADYKLYELIREHYPDKRIVVKLHPRTRINRFADKFTVMKSTSIPWEVHLLNQISSGHKLPLMVSIACVTMSSDKFLFDMETPKVILAPMFYDKIMRRDDGGVIVGPQNVQQFENLKSIYRNPKKIKIVKDIEGVFNAIDTYLSSR